MDIDTRNAEEDTTQASTSCAVALSQSFSDQSAVGQIGNSIKDTVQKVLPDLQIDLPKILGVDGTIPFGAHSKGLGNVPLHELGKTIDGMPGVWDHPPQKTFLGISLDGKCGVTGVSNMLRLYDIEKNPKDMDGFWDRSTGPGMRANNFAGLLTKYSGQKFSAKTIENGENPLDVLKESLKDGKPVAIMYMMDNKNAHWVNVTAVKDGPNGPQLTVQSWGKYYNVDFKDIKANWKEGYGGPYPYVVGTEPSSYLKKN